MNGLDWLDEFKENFDVWEMSNLKKNKFKGNLKLNFYGGKVVKVAKTISTFGRRKKVVDIDKNNTNNKGG